jgi:hypothetical protein
VRIDGIGERISGALPLAPQSLRPARVHAVGHLAQRAESRLEIALEIRRALPLRGGARRQFVRAKATPRLHQFPCHLDVALQADVKVIDHIALVRGDIVGEDAGRHRRQIERIVVPLEGGEARQAAEPLAPCAAVADVDVQPADLGFFHPLDARAQRLGHQLPAEAVAEHRHALADRVAHQSLERRDPGKLVVDAHRPAHHADPGVSRGVRGNGRAFVDRDQLRGNALRVEPRAETAGRFRRGEAEYGDRTHARILAAATTGAAPVTSA